MFCLRLVSQRLRHTTSSLDNKFYDWSYKKYSLEFESHEFSHISENIVAESLLAVEIDWHHNEQRCDPDGHTHRPRVARCAVSPRLNCSTHGQVTVSTHHRQRKHLYYMYTYLNNT